MKKTLFVSIPILIFLVLMSCSAQKAIQKSKVQTELDSLSYSYGVLIAKFIKETNNTPSVNEVVFAKAIYDYFNKEKTLINEKDAENIVKSNSMKRNKQVSNKAKDEGQKYLAENKKKDGVITLPSGLQYKILKKGTGEKPKETDKVKTHYKGLLVNGKVFDSSYDRGEPAVFPVNGVIKGWTEALLLMKPGSKWILYIPYQLAYGERGIKGVIPPFSTLIFEIELISIEN